MVPQNTENSNKNADYPYKPFLVSNTVALSENGLDILPSSLIKFSSINAKQDYLLRFTGKALYGYSPKRQERQAFQVELWATVSEWTEGRKKAILGIINNLTFHAARDAQALVKGFENKYKVVKSRLQKLVQLDFSMQTALCHTADYLKRFWDGIGALPVTALSVYAAISTSPWAVLMWVCLPNLKAVEVIIMRQDFP